MTIQSNYPTGKPSLLLDFANSKTLDPRITFARASTATYYDGKTNAKAEENLLLNSQDFTTIWANLAGGATVTTGVTAPDSSSTASLLTMDATAGSARVQSNSGGVSAGQTYTASIWVRNATTANLQLRLARNGVTTFESTAISIPQSIDWQRISVAHTYSIAHTGWRFDIINQTSIGATVEVWGAQLEQRDSVTAYTPTTTQPITNYIPVLKTAASGQARFNHSPVTDESLGFLIEEQRTNLLLRSEEFDNASWTKTSSSITANTIVSPDGALTGDKYIPDNTIAFSNTLVRTGNITKAASATTYTATVYAKSGEYNRVLLQVRDGATSANRASVIFSLVDGSIAAAASTAGTFTAALATAATLVGNGWYRCNLTFTSGAETTLNVQVSARDLAATTGDGYSGIYIWGAQLEAEAFPTSYIPTVASQVTRVADVASITGTNFSSWYNQAEGTMFAEYVRNGLTTSASPFSVDNNTQSNFMRLVFGQANPANQRFDVLTVGVSQASLLLTTTGVINTVYKSVGAYKVNDIAGTENGATVQTDVSAIIPTVTQAQIGKNSVVKYLNGTISKISYYPVRCTNAQLQALTS